MQLHVTAEAADLIRRKGGTAALDFISAVGWGGQPEVSVDIHLKGKDTRAYRLVRHEDIEVLVAPDMARWSNRVRLGTKGALFWRGFDVSVEHEHGPTWQH